MKVRIVGAGFSGLTLAYFLTKKNIEVEIFDSADRVGGLISTQFTPQGLIETAANGVWNSSLFEELIHDVNVPLAVQKPERKKRYIFRRTLKRWPLTIGESAAFVSRFGFRWLTRSLKPEPNETIEMWGERVGGRAFARYLLAPALQGIYAGSAARMSAELILARFFQKKKIKKPQIKGTVAPERGMGQLMQALELWLKERGATFTFSQPVLALSDSPWVLATSAWSAAEILKSAAPEAAEALTKAESLPLISATLFFQQVPERFRGFGCLFPEDEKFHSLGVLFNTDIFEKRGRGHSETWILGGAHHRNLIEKSDEEIVSIILADRVRLFSQFAKPIQVTITRWPKALPHYTVDWKETLANLQIPESIHLTGNYLGHIGLSRILEYNHDLAGKLAKEI